MGDVEADVCAAGGVYDLLDSVDGFGCCAAHLDVSSAACAPPVGDVYSVVGFEDLDALIHFALGCEDAWVVVEA